MASQPRSAARRLSIAALALSFCLPVSVSALAADANRSAYDMARKCLVADGHASAERNRAGDTAKAAHYDAMARQAFDVAFNAGEKLGLSDDQVKRDLDFTQQMELPRFIREPDYLRSTAATCKAVGLM